ncbi:hypothetical protein B0H21DRAFT_210945 [Amylocystis lapponica]|nr:hypothetical protein B0H21DRAFT_210945 [Amylocystis lapponica]
MSRPPTPDSPMSNSLHHATSTIDDLTLALSNFSRTSSPEPPNVSVCCCGKEDCETTRVWSAYKSKMESRLVLSAEVGQALLERHEAYVRRHESAKRPSQAQVDMTKSPEEQVDARVAELVKENAVLEKRLTQALLNNELAETSTKSSLQELEEARAHVGRLTAQNARSIGWENRLAMALQEKDDFQQERDSATHRAKLAEARISALQEKCAKLQAQANRLREDFEMQSLHRRELSEDILKDARQRLEQLQQSKLGHTVMTEDAEVTKVLESLVADNEALKRDNAELQNLLTESREDMHTLQEEVEERRASDAYRRHRYTNSGQSFRSSHSQLSPVFHVGTAPSTSVLHSAHQGAQPSRRAISSERASRRAFEPLTPETDQRPLSPTDSLTPSDTKWTSFSRPVYSASHANFEVDEEGSHEGRPPSPERTRAQRSLYLLTRSRGVQTDGMWAPSSLLPPFAESTTSSSTPPSESSSLADGQATAMGALVERVNMLLSRLTQADALTLTNRLKRQHLQGADVSHLSRTTVSSILHETATMRAHFRAFLEDDKVTTTCTRRDLRGLLKLFKEMFAEMGQMRVTLNDVILDPSVAGKVSEMALHPAKAASAETAGGDPSGNASAPSWMAPFSKLLGLPGGSTHPDNAATRALSPPARPGSRGRLPSRIVPKREAVLSASSMSVNVEFSGTAVGRSVTSTYSAHPEREDSISILAKQTMIAQPMAPPNPSRGLMGIFAGAPRPEDSADPWIVIPRAQRGATIPAVTVTNTAGPGPATLGRSALRNANRLSRTVDAVIDAQGQGELGAAADVVPNRTLRRNLSDSSVHTTFMSHGEEHGARLEDDGTPQSEHDRQSVFSAISRRMQNFRFAGPGALADAGAIADVVRSRSLSRPETPVSASRGRDGAHTPTRASSPRAIPQASGLLQTLNLSSWAASALDPTQDPTSPYFSGSPREEAFMRRPWDRERDL